MLPGHVTSPLMRQSLQASKAAQTMKKAEEQLERERVLRVLRKASTAGSGGNGNNGGAGKEGRVRSVSPGRKLVGAPGSTSSGEREREHGRPPLPARRRKTSNPSSTSSSRRSLDQVASATLLPTTTTSAPPAGPAKTQQQGPVAKSPFSRPTHAGHSNSIENGNEHDEPITNDTSPTSPISSYSHQAPPTHPDRKPTHHHHPSMRTPERSYTTPSPTSPLTPSSQSQAPCVFRSRSMHHPSPHPPPMPPPRRKGPESVQVMGSGVGDNEESGTERSRGREGSSLFFAPPHTYFTLELSQSSYL